MYLQFVDKVAWISWEKQMHRTTVEILWNRSPSR